MLNYDEMNELIIKQQLEIQELREQLEEADRLLTDYLIGIGDGEQLDQDAVKHLTPKLPSGMVTDIPNMAGKTLMEQRSGYAK